MIGNKIKDYKRIQAYRTFAKDLNSLNLSI